MMADYNGWADQREEEREYLDQLSIGFPLRLVGPPATGAHPATARPWHRLAVDRSRRPLVKLPWCHRWCQTGPARVDAGQRLKELYPAESTMVGAGQRSVSV